MSSGYLMYRCRKCGMLFRGAHYYTDVKLALTEKCATARLFYVHECSEKSFGIGDLVGNDERKKINVEDKNGKKGD